VSRRQGWLCECKQQLGELLHGAVRVSAPLPLVSADRIAVECPRCHQVRVWEREPPPKPAACGILSASGDARDSV
jgi:hypothetical protein